MFEGSAVALITPFKNDIVDYVALEKLLDFHVKAGTECILVCGTTGESATLSHEEHKEIIRFSTQFVKAARGANRHPLLMAGTGSNSTKEALELTREAKASEADVALLISPYYNKPTQEGLLYHFRTIAREVDIPQVLYNIQGRTGVNINVETLEVLSEEKNIIGVKEASGNLNQISEIARRCGDDFCVWSGDDGLTLPILSLGGKGVISVTANIVPQDVKKMVHAYLEGHPQEALRLHRQLAELNRILFIETNPVPVKTAVNLLSQSSETGLPYCGELRPPMVPLKTENEAKLKTQLAKYGLPV